MSQQYLLAIDQGTTNSRAHIFTASGKLLHTHQMTLSTRYPQKEWVEQDPEEMWMNTLTCCQKVLAASRLSVQQIAGVGIANQRETTIIWDKKTGQPIYPAISWQDQRSAHYCEQLRNHPLCAQLQAKTGLLLAPYFSASKIAWILQQVPGAFLRAENNELLFGTVDTYLLWHLTKGKMHATDATNAARTLLFNIRSQKWDEEILAMFSIPAGILPLVLDSSADFGKVDAQWLGREIPIASMIGDQQAALVGQACFQPGMIKSTYGTGCFVVMNTGSTLLQSKHHLLSTIAYRIKGKITYALEGSIFSAGTSIKWLRDHLKIIRTAQESETLAKRLDDNHGVYLIPAFTGLGAPYWAPHAKAALLGLSSNSGVEHIARATLEAVAYQTHDLIAAMQRDADLTLSALRVDGGMAENDWLMQFIANILNLKISRPVNIETTALGAAMLAGLQLGLYQSLDEIAPLWQAEQEFIPLMDELKREELCAGWNAALQKIISD
jgi:glycerol kinase